MPCIDKQNILAHAPGEEQRLVLARAYDAYIKSEKTISSCFTRFLSPAESALLYHAFGERSGVILFGGYDDAERVMAGFGAEKEDFPIDVMVSHGDFSDITHRDFLGSLMSLGITREAIGDISVEEDKAFVFLDSELSEYIAENFREVKRTTVKNELCSFYEVSVERKFEIVKKSVASQRADAVIGAAFSLSRTDSEELIAKSAVTLNYAPLTAKDKRINSGDVISVRGKGKAQIEFSGALSKKGRLFMDIKKYK